MNLQHSQQTRLIDDEYKVDFYYACQCNVAKPEIAGVGRSGG